MRPIALGLALVLASAAPVYAANEVKPVTTTQSVDYKEPWVAYALGTVPFGGFMAAAYVGTSRFDWETVQAPMNAGTGQFALDCGLLLLGALANSVGAATPLSPSNFGLQTMGMLAYAAIPIMHIKVYGPWWGEQAALVNREMAKRLGVDGVPGK